jgi:uncharacterized protein (UPF0332 family)
MSGSDLHEVDYRVVVSRSYYSAYHESLEFADNVLQLGVSNLTGPTHLKLSETFTKFVCEDKDKQRTIRRLGARMHALHSLRIRADYHLGITITKSEAESIIKNTSDLFQIIAQEKMNTAA